MATLTTLNVDIKKLGEQLKSDLPSYAQPKFIRLTSDFEHTGSFKPQKIKLTEEAYNVDIINDKVYFYDTSEKAYKELTKEIYNGILSGNVRF